MNLSILFFALQLFCLVSFVSAGSDGKNVAICNVYGPYGCPLDQFPVDRDGDLERKFCKVKSTRTMHWALAGTRNNTYRLYVDNEQNPTKSYVPGQLHYISVRVTKVRWNYRGFLIYVNDAKNATVGEFVLPKDDSPTYSRHAAYCKGAVTHAMADEKPIVMTFAWRAPAAGAGPVTVRALLKYGDANTGAFFWPNEEGDFVMSEGKAPSSAVEYRTAPAGVDCNTICSNNCDEAKTKSIAKSEVESLSFKRAAYCKLPYLVDCDEASGSIDPESFCLYRDATCPAVTMPACAVKSKTHDRVCACKGNAPPAPVITTTATNTPADTGKTPGQASTPGSNGPVGATTAPLYTSPPRTLYPKTCAPGETTCDCLADQTCSRESDVCVGHQVCPPEADASCVNFAGVCVKPDCAGEDGCACNQGRCLGDLVCNGGSCEVNAQASDASTLLTFAPSALLLTALVDRRLSWLALISTAFAHNWVASPSRAAQASTVEPALQRRSTTPHVQISKGQKFQIEWALGHGGHSYFVVMKAADEHHLQFLTRKMLDEYIADAPSGSDSIPDMPFRKYHRKNDTNYDNLLDNKFRDNKGNVNTRTHDVGFFKNEVKSSDARFRARPSTFGAPLKQLEYKDEFMKNDRRVAYKNAKMPYIMAVHRYGLDALQAYRYDFAEFELPGAGDEAEDYIVWYYWQSYRDIIDVNYLGNKAPVENVYGVKSSNTVWEKIDHCGFPDSKLSIACKEAVDRDIKDCVRQCGSKYGCRGVLLAPVILPDSVHPDFKNDHPVQWIDTGEKDERFPGSGYRSGYVNQTIRCSKDDLPLITKDTHVCVGVTPRPDTETAEGYHIAEDPRDPMWYSTCFIPKKVITFDTDAPAPKRVPLRWRYADHCVDCELAYTNSFVANRQPVWKVADKCVDCDKHFDISSVPEYNYTAPEPEWTLVKKTTACDGIFSESTKFGERYHNASNMHTCGTKYASPNQSITCLKRVTAWGNDVSRQGQRICAFAAARDAECSETVLYQTNYFAQCFCWRKDACCGKCSQRTDRFFDMYTVKKLVN